LTRLRRRNQSLLKLHPLRKQIYLGTSLEKSPGTSLEKSLEESFEKSFEME
jgi:hypothetical protein